MNCCHMQGLEDLFDDGTAASDLAAYQRRGPSKTTRMLAQALIEAGVQDQTLIDIGGGVGALQHALLAAGARSATAIDASQAYLKVARQEAARRGLAERVRFAHGNFVVLADELEPAGVVTLDRVLCCYPDVEDLVNSSAERAARLYGLVYPNDRWWIRLGGRLANAAFGLRKRHFRLFIHPEQRVEALLRENGLRRRFHWRGLLWQVAVYQRGA